MISMLIDLDEVKFKKQPLNGTSSSVDKRGVIIGKGQFSKVYLVHSEFVPNLIIRDHIATKMSQSKF